MTQAQAPNWRFLSILLLNRHHLRSEYRYLPSPYLADDMPWRVLGGYRPAHLREAASPPSSPTSPISYRRQFATVQNSTDPTIAKLLDNNSNWARAVGASEPRFFRELAKGQAPKVRPSHDHAL